MAFPIVLARSSIKNIYWKIAVFVKFLNFSLPRSMHLQHTVLHIWVFMLKILIPLLQWYPDFCIPTKIN